MLLLFSIGPTFWSAAKFYSFVHGQRNYFFSRKKNISEIISFETWIYSEVPQNSPRSSWTAAMGALNCLLCGGTNSQSKIIFDLGTGWESSKITTWVSCWIRYENYLLRFRKPPKMTAKKYCFVSQFDLVFTLSLSCIMCPGLRPFEIWLWEWISRVHFSFTTKTRANWFISDGFHIWNINENTTRSTGNILIRDKNENAFFRSLLYCWGIRILINEFNSLCLLHNIDILVDTVTKN